MSIFFVADGFGNLSDGTHTVGVSREILGQQWTSQEDAFVITDIGDGRKWMRSASDSYRIFLFSKTWTDRSVVGIAFRLNIHTTKGRILVGLYTAANEVVGYIGIDATDHIQYSRYSSGLVTQGVVATCSNTISLDTPTHVELIITVADDTSGSVAFYLDGVHVNTVSGIDTAYSTGRLCGMVKIDSGAALNRMYTQCWITDFLVHTGAAPVGDAGVFYLPASDDGTDTDFTPSEATNVEGVEDIGPDEDATYNESDGTAGHRDSFENGGISGISVLSVGALVRARKTDTGSGTLLAGVVHGGSESQSSANSLSEDYSTFLELFDVCPSTSTAWSLAQVAAAEVSYEVGS